MTRILLSCVLVLGGVLPSYGQLRPTLKEADPKVAMELVPAEVRPGQTALLRITVKLHPEYLTYPITQPDSREQESSTMLVLPEQPQDLIPIRIPDPPGYKEKPGVNQGKIAYYLGGATWEIPVVVSPKATSGAKTYKATRFRMILCIKRGADEACLPRPETFPLVANFTVNGEPVPVEEKHQALVAQALGGSLVEVKNPPKVEPKTPSNESDGPKSVVRRLSLDRDQASDLKAIKEQLPPPEVKNHGFWVFVATAAMFGILTLFTPCVFPMVPITVSVFLKQSEKQHTNPLKFALIYAITIVILLAVAALTLLTTFSRLSVHPMTNVLLGTLFVVLSLSLFGLFELTLPSSLANFIGSKEGKGGYLGIVFMAVSFTIVSFTCVAPFLGGFSGMAASGQFSTWQLAIGALVFATAFASPFFLLALFPSLLKKLPKSGDWMNTIKVTMGFLELAAALKFFRTAELRWSVPPEFFTYDIVLATWVVILAVMGLYLIGLFRMSHDHAEHIHVGPLRLMFALASLALAIYLTPALFSSGAHDRNRPGGKVYAWVDAFLLPEPSAAEIVGSELNWSGDLRRSIEDARATGGRVFIDFTGKTCTNCKLNERTVFTKPEVKELLKKFTLTQLYTDTVPAEFYDAPPGLSRQDADAAHNLQFEKDAFGAEQLPLYVILKPEASGKTSVVGVYDEGKINNEAAFIEFLKNGLK